LASARRATPFLAGAAVAGLGLDRNQRDRQQDLPSFGATVAVVLLKAEAANLSSSPSVGPSLAPARSRRASVRAQSL
jgi:hypothetical protein